MQQVVVCEVVLFCIVCAVLFVVIVALCDTRLTQR